ncbi:MAG: hypothetical protein NZL93_04215, partial [Chthoniobacterales bacterium]|nr:hypothetical protein [Chthoniobacterales bacterium]
EKTPRAFVLLCQWILSIKNLLTHFQRSSVIFVSFPVIMSIVLLVNSYFDDDIKRLNRLDLPAFKDDEEIRKILGRSNAQIAVVSIGQDDEEALQKMERFHPILLKLLEDGVIQEFYSPIDWIRSNKTQKVVEAAFRSDPEFPARVKSSLEENGFVVDYFSPFFEFLKETPPAPVTIDLFLGSSLLVLLKNFRMEFIEHQKRVVAYFCWIRKVHDRKRLIDVVSKNHHVFLLDVEKYLNLLVASMRKNIFYATLVGLLSVILACYVKYKKVLLAVGVVLPGVFASLLALALVSLFSPLNLMHMVACILVVSMAEDYSVFVFDHSRSTAHLGSAMVGNLLAALTTVASFGLMSMSAHPILRSIGLVTAVGVTLSFCFSLIVASWIGGRRATLCSELNSRWIERLQKWLQK